MGSDPGRGARRRLLDADPAFATGLDGSEREAARNALIVEVRRLPVGEWTPSRVEPEPGHLGFLILAGLMTRELRVVDARSIELLNLGDLVRPWDEDAASFVDARWVVRETVELGILDRTVSLRLHRWPELASAIVARGLQRSRSLAVHAAIESLRGLEPRLLTLFWHFAERWGTRRSDGIVIPLDLTHQMISDLVGARRPSVTSALGALSRSGLLVRTDGGWLLRGDPPAAQVPDRGVAEAEADTSTTGR